MIPESLMALLRGIPSRGRYFFVRGESTAMHTAADLWRRRIKALCKAAKIVPDHPKLERVCQARELFSQRPSEIDRDAPFLDADPRVLKPIR